MPRRDEILVVIIIEKGSKGLQSLIAPFLTDYQELNFLFIDNASGIDYIDDLAKEHAYIFVHKRPIQIHHAIAYNYALEIALNKGYKGVFIWSDTATSYSPTALRQLSYQSEQALSVGIIIPQANDQSLYIPRKTLLEVGVFYPFIKASAIREEYTSRIQQIGLEVRYTSDDTSLNTYVRYNDRSKYDSKLLDEYKTLKKSARYWLQKPQVNLSGLSRAINRKEFAPVLLLVYNRPEHTKRLLHDFWTQMEAPQTPLYILSDGGDGTDEVRRICTALAENNPNVTLWCQANNQGLARNVTEGVHRVLELHESVIVLEDDLRLSPYFLRWMNDALEAYKDTKQIAHLHAGTFYTSSKLHNNHALRFAGSWGWATWRDRWATLWEPDGEKLLAELLATPTLQKHFDYGGYMKFTKMLRQQTLGQNNSWAIRWHASILLNNKISINTNPPLVSNDGFDGTGTHSSADDRYNTGVCPYPLYVDNSATIPISEEPHARKILLRYYRRTNNKLSKGWYKLKEIIRR